VEALEKGTGTKMTMAFFAVADLDLMKQQYQHCSYM
jgi:hypothetical protein